MYIRSLGLVFSFILSLAAFGGETTVALLSKDEGKVWANIPFFKAGNLHEFEAELGRTRQEARGQLLGELGSMLLPLAMTTDDVAGLALVLANIIKDFDSLVRQHERAAHEGIPTSLQELLKANFDELFNVHRLPPELQKGRFYGASLKPSELVKHVRFIAYGSYSVISGGRVKATLTLEELVSGKTQAFLVQGTIAQAAKGLAQKLFDFFHSNKYPDWINPQPQLEWVAPVAPDQAVLATVARRYCQGQGARLPYAEELIQASLGGDYRRGGIVLKKNRYYIVADRQRSVDQYYYNTFPWGNSQTGGPVQTAAGLGRVEAHVWCVKGLPSQNIRLVEGIYRLLREANDSEVVGALEFILVHLQDFGMRTWMSGNFRSVDEATALLHRKGILIEVPAY